MKDAPLPQMTDAATSIAQMVTEWVDGGIAMGTDWRPGLAPIISKRLARFSNAEVAALKRQLVEALSDGNSMGVQMVEDAETRNETRHNGEETE